MYGNYHKYYKLAPELQLLRILLHMNTVQEIVKWEIFTSVQQNTVCKQKCLLHYEIALSNEVEKLISTTKMKVSSELTCYRFLQEKRFYLFILAIIHFFFFNFSFPLIVCIWGLRSLWRKQIVFSSQILQECVSELSFWPFSFLSHIFFEKYDE